MNTQENNQLIAEFMGWDINSPSTFPIDLHQEDSLQGHWELKFHTSWDWLMPVVEKCFVKQEEVSDDLSFKLNDALLETNRESLYRVVVEFIKQYNNQ